MLSPNVDACFDSQGGWEMVAHHIAATLSIWIAITSSQGHFYTLTLLATEVTTPFVNLRWHLDVAVRLPALYHCSRLCPLSLCH